MSALPPYIYRPLATETTIRILILHPAEDFATPLEVSIDHYDRRGEYNMCHSGYYQAVSYTWGEPIFSHNVLVRNPLSTLEVTANVDSMLRHLRKVRKNRNIWVDAMCLNQADANEKSIQVRKMGEIFAEAAKVHVWLGLETRFIAEVVFTYLRRTVIINRAMDESKRTPQEYFGKSQRYLDESLQQLLLLPWFQRRWVLQEVALALDVTFHCGDQRLAWKWVRDGIAVFHQGYGRVQDRWAERSITRGVRQAIENVISLSSGTTKSTDILQLLWNHQVSFKH
jgi:hypothetical protein